MVARRLPTILACVQCAVFSHQAGDSRLPERIASKSPAQVRDEAMASTDMGIRRREKFATLHLRSALAARHHRCAAIDELDLYQSLGRLGEESPASSNESDHSPFTVRCNGSQDRYYTRGTGP